MLNVISDAVIRESIAYYGKQAQSTVCMEECAELIQAISKELRGNSDIHHLSEEMADVLICLKYLQEMYQVSDEMLTTWIDAKLQRIQKRMQANPRKEEKEGEYRDE